MSDNEEKGVVGAVKSLAKVDWKSLAIIVTALTGALGFAWNKVEMYVEQHVQRTASAGTYQVIAKRVDELYQRVETLESHSYTMPYKAELVIKRTEDSSTEHPIYPNARMPEYAIIQQAAEDNNLDALLIKVAQ